MTLEGDSVVDDPIKDGVLESYNTDSQCKLEAEPEENKGQRSQKTEDSSIVTHVETLTLEDDSNGTNSRHDSSVDINAHTDTNTAAFTALSRNQRRRMKKKQRLNFSRITDEVQASPADFDLTGTKENSLTSERQSDSLGSPSGSMVNKHNGDGPLIVVASVKRNKQMLGTSVITDKAHFPPAELNRSDERIYGKEIDSHRTPISNQVAAHILAEKETNHIEGELRSSGRNRKKSFHSKHRQSTIIAEGVVSNSVEMHSTKIANNEKDGIRNVSIEKHNLNQQVHPLVGAHFECTNKKLLILDVNGLLADIVSQTDRKYKHDIIVSRKYVFKRPFCDSFLHFCFEKFNVGVWSSRLRTNLDTIVNFLMPDSRLKLLFCWDQSHCTNTGFTTPSNIRKPLFLKELKKLWDKLEPGIQWNKGEYNETNTLLIDDSPYKALSNPANTAIFPHSYDHKNAEDCSLGPGGDLRAYLEKLAEAPNVQEYVACNPFGQKAITELNDFHQKVLRSVSRDESSVEIAICSEPPPPLPLPPPPPLLLPPQLEALNLGTAPIDDSSQFQYSGLLPRCNFVNQMSTGNSHVSVEPGVRSRHEISPLFSTRDVERLLPRAGDDQYDPFLDSIEPSLNSINKSDHILKLEAPGSSGIVQSVKEPTLPLDVEENSKKKDFGGIAFATSPNIKEFGVSAGDVENGNRGDRDALESTDMAEMEIDQKKSSGTSKKSEESRSMKLFKASLSDFVKEVLNPLWKNGDISREAYKTVVKKAVDKVLGSMRSHHMPKSKEKINKYIDSSERKITKLVMGYVDKYA